MSPQARYFPRRPGDQLWTYILTRLRAPVPGSCGGNGFDTFCPCSLLLASEHRHRWRPRWLGVCEPGTGSWHGPGAAAQRCHAGPGCSCPDALGRGFPLTVLDLQALGKSAKRAGFLGGGGWRGGSDSGRTGAASAHPHGTGWPGECAWARARRAEAEVRRKVLPGTQEPAPHRQPQAGGLCGGLGGLGLHLGDYPGFESVMRCGGDVTRETVPGWGARGHGARIRGADCSLAVDLTCSWRPQPVCGTPGTRFRPL